MKKRVAIIGTGNIGTDLMYKVLKSNKLRLSVFVGRRESENIQRAIKEGVNTSIKGIEWFEEFGDGIDIVFDCTDAKTAKENYKTFYKNKIKVIDLTPAKIGEMCVPSINQNEISDQQNINMITCGGQTSIPLLNLISKYCEMTYIEVVSQIAAKSAGMATRENIDNYIHTTEKAIEKFTNCKNNKVILNLNPAEHEVNMQTTMFIRFKNLENENKLFLNLIEKIKEIQEYVPGYDYTVPPFINEEGILILSVKVVGAGDYLDTFSGNLDIINCAAIKIAESI